MVWPCFKVFWCSKDNPTGQDERKMKKRQTEETVGRQYQRVETGIDCASSARAAENRTRSKGIVTIYLWSPNDLPRLWDRIE